MSQNPASPAKTPYPASLAIDYPDRQLNRLTSFFRIFVIIPIAIVAASITGFSYTWNNWNHPLRGDPHTTALYGVSILFLPALLMILFRKKYPRWWFDWNLALTRFTLRVGSYFVLLRDEYPSTDEEQAVHVSLTYPDADKELQRGMPLVKWFLAIPHYIVLIFLAIAALVCVIIAWFAILFTGRYPRGLFDFVVGVQRWGLRVNAYVFLLITDRYPPFSLAAEA